MMAQGWPFITRRPPVIVDWLPWNHTFGGNHNFNLVLRNGGTLYIDGGRPVPGLDRRRPCATSPRVSPTIYFNVPRGYDLLVPRLESDAALRRDRSSASSTRVFYAAAALPQNLWERLEALAVAERARRPGDALGLGLDRDLAAGHRRCTSRIERAGRHRPAGGRAAS